MNTIPTLFKSITDLLQVSSAFNELKIDFKKIQASVYEIDKRLIRIKAFFEMMKIQQKSLHHD